MTTDQPSSQNTRSLIKEGRDEVARHATAPALAHDNCASFDRRTPPRHGGGAALLALSQSPRLVAIQTSAAGVASDAEVEKALNKKETPPRRGISSFISAEFSRQPGIGGDRGAV
jgi:hypothetical protein